MARPVRAGGLGSASRIPAMALSRTAPALPNAGRAALPPPPPRNPPSHGALARSSPPSPCMRGRTGTAFRAAARSPAAAIGAGTLPLHGIQLTGHRSVAVQPRCLRPTRGRDRSLPTGSSAHPPLRRVSPAAVPWRLECRHDASTERPRQATCRRQEGGSAPAPRFPTCASATRLRQTRWQRALGPNCGN